VQRSSYDQFLQMNIKPAARAVLGLQEVFRSVFPIKDFSERAELDLFPTSSKSRNTTSRSASSGA